MVDAPPSRLAVPDDRAILLAVLLEAFRADPFWVHFMPDPDQPGFAAPDGLDACMQADVDAYITHGHCHRIDDSAVALWAPPGIRADDEDLANAFGRHADPALTEAALPQFLELGERRPDTPHFYLHLIAATDAARGGGLGTILLRRVLDVCDAEGIPAYLEASTLRSAALYERHGFETIARVEFAPGVVLHPMLRPGA